MAQRRMFSLQIVDTDAFLDMSQTSQLLYFHLAMRADDDGFVGNPKKIMRTMGANDDDYKILVAKRFLLIFESGVVVIKHWKIHNYIQNDRYHETKYLEEKKDLITKENGSYTERIQDVSKVDTEVRLELGKVRQGKSEKDTNEQSSLIAETINLFKEINPSYQKLFGSPPQRKATKRLLDIHGFEKIKKVCALLPKTNNMPYLPNITTPSQLEDKWASLEAGLTKEKNKIKSNYTGIA